MDQAERLRRAIDNLKKKQFSDTMLPPLPKLRNKAKVITVTSGKGGVGKTNVSVNLAIALSEKGYRVVILDADFGLANIDVLLGISPKYTLLDLVKNQKNIFEVLTNGPNNIKFISGGSGVEDLIKLDIQQVSAFVENISLLDRLADIVIVDTGAGLSETVMSFIMASDEVLLVTTPEPTSITDAYALIKMVSNRDKTKKIKVIVNKSENADEAKDVLKKLVMVTEKFLGLTIEPAGYILKDSCVEKAVKRQEPFSISFPKSQATKNIKEISEKLTENDGVKGGFHQNTGIRGFFDRLFGFINT